MKLDFTGMSVKEMAEATRISHDQWIDIVAKSGSGQDLSEAQPYQRAHELAVAVLTWAEKNAEKYKGIPVYEEMIQKATLVDDVYNKIVGFRESALFLDAVVAIKKELPQTGEKAMAAVEAMAEIELMAATEVMEAVEAMAAAD
ncbi:hypothetical protein [Stenoxybacter acetivorans]|uniref:hypothetical protein n=1 Tax=Stenoxybacter acetivorans TaxID=422441 RepID=UPI000566BFEE|nr:hypothetical protein [Stenoxybacter acetivorans]